MNGVNEAINIFVKYRIFIKPSLWMNTLWVTPAPLPTKPAKIRTNAQYTLHIKMFSENQPTCGSQRPTGFARHANHSVHAYWKPLIEKCAHARTPRIPVRPFVGSHCVRAVAIVRSSPNQTRPAGNIASVGCSTFADDKMQIFPAQTVKQLFGSETTAKRYYNIYILFIFTAV